MRRLLPLLVVVPLLAAGCGRDGDDAGGGLGRTPQPQAIGQKSPASTDQATAPREFGFPVFATKNTIRIAGQDPVLDAAAVVHAVFSGGSPQARPRAVVLADRRDWRAVLASSALMGQPLRAPILLSDGPTTLPDATRETLESLPPTGSKAAGGAQVVRIGAVPAFPKYKSTDVRGGSPAALARAIDAFVSAARGQTSDRVLVVPSDNPRFALPAAAWAAKSGDPILFVTKDAVPEDTKAAITAHQQPKIYVLGPSSVVSPKVTRELRKLGTVERVGGQDPVANAIEFARYADGSFGFGIVDPGHGMVLARQDMDPALAGVLAPLSASGAYGPLLLLDGPTMLPRGLQQFLLDIQPGYERDPVRGVYNRAWIVGDEETVSPRLQSDVDRFLEIVPVSQRAPQR